MKTPEKLTYQINSAVNACNGRISCGADTDEAFKWLQDELQQIYNGEEVYEDNSEPEDNSHLKFISIEKGKRLQANMALLDNLMEPCRITATTNADEIPELTKLAIELAEINTRREEIISTLENY